MHYILYALAAASILTGAVWGWMEGNVMFLANGLLVAVVFGAAGKSLHLLTHIERHLRISQIRRTIAGDRRKRQIPFEGPDRRTGRDRRSATERTRAA